MSAPQRVARAPEGAEAEGLLAIRQLTVTLESPQGRLLLLDRVSVTVRPGEVVALVGETGSGKTLTGMAAVGLFPAGARVEGRVTVDGLSVVPLAPGALRGVRGRRVAIIPQNPSTALNPVFTIGQQMGELVATHQGVRSPASQRQIILDLLREVELPRPEAIYASYPHHLSGGMQQRALIAMALACRPKLIVADEPTTALDVTTQAQILRTLEKVRRQHGLAMLWITHDLGVAAYLADRVVVLYAGAVVEQGPVDRVLGAPAHPYTRAVIDSLPGRGRKVREIRSLPGDLPSPAAIPPGCRFHPRCPSRLEVCDRRVPQEVPLASGQRVACHLYRDEAAEEVSRS